MDQKYNFTGKILIAHPAMDDDNFIKSVILICAHEEDGTIGVVINKPIATFTHEDICKQLKINGKIKDPKKKNKYTIFNGGPVDGDKMFVATINSEKQESGSCIDLYTNVPAFLKDVMMGIRKEKFLLCLGFCAWEYGQLEEEMQENAWMVVDAPLDEVFVGDPTKKWDLMSQKIGITDPCNIVSYSGNA